MTVTRLTQEAKIIDYLKKHRFASGFDLVNKCHVLSYTKVISNINSDAPGLIGSDWHENLRTGNRYKVYFLVGSIVDVMA